MPRFELKETEIKNGEKFITYGDFARAALNNTPQSGFSVDDMRKRIKILDKLDDSQYDCIELSVEETKVLKSAVSGMKWGVIHKDILAFCDAVEALGE